MVIKTDLCAFSESRIYPGWGTHFVRRDGQTLIFATSKSAALYHLRKKPAKLTWTHAWRRKHRKGRTAGGTKKRTRRIAKFQRAIVGVSLDEIKARQTQRPAERKAAREADARAVKEKRKKAKAQRKAAGGAAKGRGAVAKHAGKGR
uniref:Large ribosomal subunit protein eL24-related N-terminal domain-containing protein n=1 Tax=Bicosoecida sp. CB-2014 TaxID=1486930 RepID=A0A7S1G7B8_9STRA|mmetsp:Transcript_18881/g.66720  ORF Transcript_18881/g.66720 Transcript_18881/m.66720 type:complete len:147 (+) Transcript_18881:56-496(+)